MTAAKPLPPWAARPNPFPPGAIAVVHGLAAAPTIETAAVQQVRRQVDEYLTATESDPPSMGASLARGSGLVIVISGEYGTGKSHLALEVLAHIDRAEPLVRDSAQRIYLSTPGNTFTLLYRDLMKDWLPPKELLDRVRELYSEVILEAMRESDLISAERLEQFIVPPGDPAALVEALGLTQSALLDGLREKLRVITENEVFVSALSLLVQPRFEDEVWRWLCGERPTSALCERGITATLSEDRLALEALGVVALLFGRRGHRFVLVLDEMEKLVLSGLRDSAAVIAAFKNMLETFRKAGALLACCGLPEIFNLLPGDTGRIEPTVVPSTLTAQDVSWYIRECQRSRGGEASLAPFDEESVDLLVQLSGGVAREVVRLCYSCYNAAASARTEVTSDMLRQVARTVFSRQSPVQVRQEVFSLLKAEGWIPRSETTVPGLPESPQVDFWFPFTTADEESAAGCAVFVTDSALDQREVESLVERARAVRSGIPRREVLLVSCGYLSRSICETLAAAFTTWPVLYDQRSFPVKFTEALNTAIDSQGRGYATVPRSPDSISAETYHPESAELLALLERIYRRQSETHSALRNLTERTETIEAESAENFSVLRQEIHYSSSAGGAAGQELDHRLPEEVQGRFDDVRRKLAFFGDLTDICTRILRAGSEVEGEGIFPVTVRLRADAVYSSIGAATLLRTLVDQFQAVVAEVSGAASNPISAQRRITNACSTFDSVRRTVSLPRLDELADLAVALGGAETRTSRFRQRNDLEQSLAELTEGVRSWAARRPA